VQAIADNGWLADHAVVLTGYLPTPAHVALAVDLIARMRAARTDLRVVVDPILGDHPRGLYVDAEAAAAIRDDLVPLADVLTPNRFELGWLSGHAVDDPEAARDAAASLLARDGARVLVTSAPMTRGATGVMEVTADQIVLYRHSTYTAVPAGVGDVFAALIAADLPVGAALGHLDALIAASSGAPHLAIIPAQADWMAAPAIPPAPVEE